MKSFLFPFWCRKFFEGDEENRLGKIEKRSIGASEEASAIDLEGIDFSIQLGW